ncbi:hypothetical protein SDC9_97722 [bioreactor metagenome]|uniref:Uncharacterized protein n=1 Tax=bioreactor metagenome TaxID=1076179 RepID=A0A645ADE1_9ZZZZ
MSGAFFRDLNLTVRNQVDIMTAGRDDQFVRSSLDITDCETERLGSLILIKRIIIIRISGNKRRIIDSIAF